MPLSPSAGLSEGCGNGGVSGAKDGVGGVSGAENGEGGVRGPIAQGDGLGGVSGCMGGVSVINGASVTPMSPLSNGFVKLFDMAHVFKTFLIVYYLLSVGLLHYIKKHPQGPLN